MRRLLPSLALLLVLAACGDDSPVVADPDDLELEIVSGDHQVAPVADAAEASAALAPAQTVPEGVLPERLVARITIDGEEPQASIGALAGPAFAMLPANTSITYRVVQPDVPASFGATPCGQSFVDSAIPDDSGYVATYWERGTWAGDCTMEVRLVTDSGPVVDTVFTATFTPGPATGSPGLLGINEVGETHDYNFSLDGQSECGGQYSDPYGNPIQYRVTASQFLAVADTTLGATSACTVLVADSTVVAGDTATMQLLREGDQLLLDLLVTVTGPIDASYPGAGIPVVLEARTVNY